MELELKHLAAYLPYKLKCQFIHSCKIGTISNIYTIGEGYDNEDIKISIDFLYREHIWMFKPILRPLSDIEDDEINTPEYLQSCCYSYVQHLLEQHYDIFGLIKNNLAIDINTLENGK